MWDYSFYAQFMETSERNQNDLAVLMGTTNDKSNSIFQDFTLTFAINNSNTPFVIPMTGIYGVMTHYGKAVIIPVLPKLAMVLMDSESTAHMVENNTLKMLETNDDECIMEMNKKAFETQKKLGYGFVAAPNKEVLNELLNR